MNFYRYGANLLFALRVVDQNPQPDARVLKGIVCRHLANNAADSVVLTEGATNFGFLLLRDSLLRQRIYRSNHKDIVLAK